MSSKRIQILDVVEKKSQKGNVYWVGQCIVYDKDGKPKVGEFWHFNKDLPLSVGEFVAEFEVDVDMDRKVSASMVSLTPIGRQSAPASPAAASK